MEIYTKSIDILAMMHCTTAALENEINRLRQKIDDTAAVYQAENERLNQLLQDLYPLRKESARLQQLAQKRETELKTAKTELEELESGKKCRMLETDLDVMQEDLDATKEELERESAELKRREKRDVRLRELCGALEEVLTERGFAEKDGI